MTALGDVTGPEAERLPVTHIGRFVAAVCSMFPAADLGVLHAALLF